MTSSEEYAREAEIYLSRATTYNSLSTTATRERDAVLGSAYAQLATAAAIREQTAAMAWPIVIAQPSNRDGEPAWPEGEQA